MSPIIVDYLGFPCDMARARERFAEPAADARRAALRELRRHIARGIHDMIDRQEIECAGLEAAIDVLPCSTDDDRVGAILTMARAYSIDSANKLFQLAGQVVALLDHDVDEAKQDTTTKGGAL